jgi:hypothetical protein
LTADGSLTCYIFWSKCASNVTLPEWLTGSPAIKQLKRLGFARECSNRSGDDFFFSFSESGRVYPLFGSRCVLTDARANCVGLESSMSVNKYSNLPDIVRILFRSCDLLG